MRPTPATGTEADPERCLRIAQGSSLGCGSFAVVYRATWCGLQCALKVLRPQYSIPEFAGPEADMLRREGHALMRHPHRFLARCHAVVELPPNFPGLAPGYKRPVPAIVLELMEEGSLQRLLRRQRLAPWRPLYDTATALAWSTQIASALAHLHGLSPPVIHRDIKPDNVLLTGRPQLPQQQQHPRQRTGLLGSWAGGGPYGSGRTAVAKLVDLGLHANPQGERHQQQPIFRASASFGAQRTLGPIGGSGGSPEDCAGAPANRFAKLSLSSADATISVADADGGGGRDGYDAGGGADRPSAGGSRGSPAGGAVRASPTSLFFAEVRIDGESRMMPVDPRSPGFGNLDEPLLLLPPPPSPPPPAATAPSRRRPLARFPRSEPLPEPGGVELVPGRAGGQEGGGVAAAAAVMGSAVVSAPRPAALRPHSRLLRSSPLPLEELQLPVRLSPLPPPRSPLSPPLPPPRSPVPRQLLHRPSEDGVRQAPYGNDIGGGTASPGVPLPPPPPPPPPSPPLLGHARPLLVYVVRPSELCTALPPVCRTPPPSQPPRRLGSMPSAGGEGGDVDCGTWHTGGSEAASAMGLCSVASGLSVHFPYPVPESEVAVVEGRAVAQLGGGPPTCTASGCSPAAAAATTAAATAAAAAAAAAAATSKAASVGAGAMAPGRSTHLSLPQRVQYRARRQQQLQPQPHLYGMNVRGVAAVAVGVSYPPYGNHDVLQEIPFLPSTGGVSCREGEDEARPPYTPQHLTPPLRSPVSARGIIPTAPPLMAPPPSRLSYEKVFRLTGETGSCMTMAPEVFLTLPYNEKADVFSFGVLMYELFTRSLLIASYIGVKRPELPFVITRCEQYTELVARGFRPSRVGAIPDPVWALITECWDQDPVVRPHMSDVVRRLEEIAAAASRPARSEGGSLVMVSSAQRGSDAGRSSAACSGGAGVGRASAGAAAAAAAADLSVAGLAGGIPVTQEGAVAVDDHRDDEGGGSAGRGGSVRCVARCYPGCTIS